MPDREEEESMDSPQESSSLSSSYGSPGSDLAELRHLKTQFGQQEQLLGQLRNALQGNSDRLASKEQEDYASRLAKMRQSRKTSSTFTSAAPASSTPKLPEESGSGGKKSRSAKMQLLRKQLEESRQKEEMESVSRANLEELVAGLQRELEERDMMIANLNLSSSTSSVISSPFVMSPHGGSPGDSPGDSTPPAGYSEGYSSAGSYLHEQLSAKENKVIQLNGEVAELRRKVFDLEEALSEKEQVLSARTAAVGLASASLAAKGRDTLDQLEDTRKELARVQDTWAGEQQLWRREREEARIEVEAATARAEAAEEAAKRQARRGEELESKSRELRQEVSRLQEEVAVVRSRAREERILLEARLEEVEEQALGERERAVVREKILDERIKKSERRWEGEKGDREATLTNALAEVEEEKGALQLKLVDLEELQSSEVKLKQRVKDAEERNRGLTDELESQQRAAEMVEAEKTDLLEALGTRDTTLIELEEEVARLVAAREAASRDKLELEIRCVQLEEARDRWEGERLELQQSIDLEKAEVKTGQAEIASLQGELAKLQKEHVEFGKEHAAAVERAAMYDRDMLDKARKIKEQGIELKSLENLLHSKTKEMMEGLGDVDLKQKELEKAAEKIEGLEDAIGRKEAELEELRGVVEGSREQQVLVEAKQRSENLQAQVNELTNERKELKDKLESEQGLHAQMTERNESEKEALNSLLEKVDQERQSAEESFTEKINTLEAQLRQKAEENEVNKISLQEALKDNEDGMSNLNEVKSLLSQSEVSLDEQKVALEGLQARLEEKEAALENAEKDLANVSADMTTVSEEVEGLKKSLASKNQVVEKFKQKVLELKQTVKEGEEKVVGLENDLALKTDESKTLTEEMMSKYQIISDLQAEVEELEKMKAEFEEKRKEDAESLEKLSADLEQSTLRKKEVELESLAKESAMARLQTVIDVFEKRSAESSNDADDIKLRLAQVSGELEEKTAENKRLLEEGQSTLKSLERNTAEKNTYLEQVDQLRAEISAMASNIEDKSSEIEGIKKELEEAQHQIQMKADEVAQLEREVASKTETVLLGSSQQESVVSKDEKISSENFQNQEEINQLRERNEKLEDDMSKMLEQIELLRMQLREKSDLLEASQSDVKLREELEARVEELEIRGQEVDDLHLMLRRSEAEKASMQNRLQEVEKETFQHLQETSEKVKEMRIQHESEVEVVKKEKGDLESRITSLEADLKNVTTKYEDVLNSTSSADLIRERDNLKDKCDKLTNMCKKYLAKLKQQEASVKESEDGESEALKNKITDLESALEAARADCEMVNEDMLTKYKIIEELQTEVASKEEELEKKNQEITEKEKMMMERELEKEDLIRDLKLKLEAAPEDITVPVDSAAALAEANQAKNELQSLKEKCKKLIVKVKQQDAQLKKIGKDKSGDKDSPASPNNDDARMKSLIEQVEQLEALMEESRTENEKLKEKIAEEGQTYQAQKNVDAKALKKMEDKVSSMVKEREEQCGQLVELRAALQQLEVANHSLKQRAEEAAAEVRRVHEGRITAQMAASPLLTSEPQVHVGEDGDDGWGSPEPAKSQQAASQQLQQEDGWGGWEQEDAEEEGWGGWEDEAGRRGSAPTFPEGPKPEGESVGGEREADLEDGWGDDSWGGHSTGGEATSLAANLRLSEDDATIRGFVNDVFQLLGKPSTTLDRLGQEEDGLAGRESRERSTSTELGTPDGARAQALELQGKIAEKEGVIETLEMELNNIRSRFSQLEDELTEAQDARDEAEKDLSSAKKSNSILVAEAEGEKEKLEQLTKEAERVAEMTELVERVKQENLDLSGRLEEERRLHNTASLKLGELDAMAMQLKELEALQEAEEKLREEVTILTKQLKDEDLRGKEENEKWSGKVNHLEAELQSLSEQLEENGREMSEKISQVTHLEQKLAEALTREAESKAQKEEVESREDEGLLEQVEMLAGRVEGLQEEVTRRREEAAEVGLARQLLLEQLEEREGERRGAVARLAEAEQRITALQEELSNVRAAASRPLAPPDLTHGSRPDITGGQRQPLDLVPGEEAWHQWQEDFEPQLPGQLEIPDVEQVHAGLQQDGRVREQQEEIERLGEEVRLLQSRVEELSGENQQLQESLMRFEQEKKDLQESLSQMGANQEHLQEMLSQAEKEKDSANVKLEAQDLERQQLHDSLCAVELERHRLVSQESDVVLDLKGKLATAEDSIKTVEQQMRNATFEKEHLETQVNNYQTQIEQLQTQVQHAEQQYRVLEEKMNETSGAAAEQDGRPIEQLASRQAAQVLTEEQPVATWAQLAPTGTSEMQGGGGGGWAPHVWGQADNSAASFFDQPAQTENNSTTDFFDSPQVQQSQAAQWSATDSAHSLQQQDQLRSRVVAADQLATSNDQLTSANQQLTVANDQLTASNQQLTASNSQLEVEVAGLKERLALNESRLTELGQKLEENRFVFVDQEAKLAAATSETEQLKNQLASAVSSLESSNTTISHLQAEVERLGHESNVGGDGNLQPPSALPSTLPAQEDIVAASTTSSNLFSQEASTASLFGAEPSSTASLFPDQPSSTASLFAQESSSTASLFQEEPAATSLFNQGETVTQTPAPTTEPQANMQEGSSVQESAGSAEITWYQEQLASYQQALHEWQLWGEQQAAEIEQLKQQLEQQAGQVEQLRQQGMQDQVTMKQLEVQDLRETVERLESEKEELNEEVREMRITIDELRNLNDTAQQTFGNVDDSIQMEELRSSLELAEKEKGRLVKDLQEQRDSTEKLSSQLKESLRQKDVDLENLGKKITGYTEQVRELEESLAAEKKAQDEVADEFEAMQLQVQESDARVNELLGQLEAAKIAAEEAKAATSEPVEKVEVAEELKVGDDPAIDGVAASSEEIAQYQQSLADWAVWAEGKTQEYNVLLEAYNQYVEAYKALQDELEAAKVNTAAVDSSVSDEMALLKRELEEKEQLRQEKEVAWVEMVEELREKKEEIACLKPAIETLESEKQEKELALVEMAEELREKNEKIACLEPALEALESKTSEAKSEDSKQLLAAEIEQKNALLLTMEAEKVQALAEVEELQEKLKYLEREVSELKDCSSAFETQLYDVGKKLSEKEAELSAIQTDSQSISAVSSELEQYKAALQEWSLWAEARTSEIAALQQERDGLLQQVQEKEAELVEKSGSIARLSIQSALTARSSAPVEDSFEASLGAQQEQLRKEREQQEAEERVEVLQEKLNSAELRIDQMATALEQAQEALTRSVQEKKQVEEKLQEQSSGGKEDAEVQETAATPGWGESDEGWGVEQSELQGEPSANQEDVLALETEISELKEKIRNIELDKSKLQEELNAAKLKNGKMLVKVKTLTKEVETLKKKKPASSGFDDLDRAMEDELKSQADKALKEAAEARKEVDVVKQEREVLQKKCETLEAGHLRLVEMKEKQDFEMEFLSNKNKELDSQVSGLQWSLAEVEERREEEVNELTSKLAVLTSSEDGENDSAAIRLQVASLTAQLEASTSETDRLRSDLTTLARAREAAEQEVTLVRGQAVDLQDLLDRLREEKEELEIQCRGLKVEGGSGFDEIQRLNQSLNQEIAGLRAAIVEQQGRGAGLGVGVKEMETGEGEVERLRAMVAKEQALVVQLEADLRYQEQQMQRLEVELESARKEKSDRRHRQESLGSRESEDRELRDVFSDTNLMTENLKLKADLDSSMRERRQLASRIHSWQEELGKEAVLDDEGLRAELRQAIKALQVKEHKMEELVEENLRLLEERDTLMLKLSTVMRQLEGSRAASAMSSMAGSRSTTPLPHGSHHHQLLSGDHFDPHAEIRELHSKLEELRRLNYSLDVELQKERGERQDLGNRVMAPRARRASQVLPDSPSRVQDQGVQHM